MSHDADHDIPARTPRTSVSLPSVARFAMAVIIATGVLVVLTRLVTGSWVAGGVVGAVAGGVSVVVYPWLVKSTQE